MSLKIDEVMPVGIDGLGVENCKNARRVYIRPNLTGNSTLERIPASDEFTLSQNANKGKLYRKAIGLAAGLFALGTLFGAGVQAKADGVEPDYTVFTESLKEEPLMAKGDDYLHSRYEDAINKLIDEIEADKEAGEYQEEEE